MIRLFKKFIFLILALFIFASSWFFIVGLNLASAVTSTFLGQGSTITVSGNWSNSGTFTPGTSTVIFNSGNTASISGTTTFNNLTITHTATKQVNFQTSGSPIFNVTGLFTVTGSTGEPIKLYSDSTPTKWKFNPTGTASVSYVDVKDAGCEATAISINPTNFTGSNYDDCWGSPSITMTMSLDDPTIGFGDLSPLSARYATGNLAGSGVETSAHTIEVASSGTVSGYYLYVQGSTLTNTSNSNNTISAIGGTPAASNPGNEQFGIRSTVSGGSATVSSPYNHATNYGYAGTASTQSTIGSASADSTDTFTMYYLCNIGIATESGDYSTSLTYTAVGSF